MRHNVTEAEKHYSNEAKLYFTKNNELTKAMSGELVK